MTVEVGNRRDVVRPYRAKDLLESLNQAGVKDDFVRLEDVGIHGNMHEMFLDKNSDVVIKYIDDWLRKNVK